MTIDEAIEKIDRLESNSGVCIYGQDLINALSLHCTGLNHDIAKYLIDKNLVQEILDTAADYLNMSVGDLITDCIVDAMEDIIGCDKLKELRR